MPITEQLTQELEAFSQIYAPMKSSERLSDVEKEALADRRGWTEKVLRKKGFYVGKTAEKIANSHDLTFRAEIKIAKIAVNGETWERVLVNKNADLCVKIQRVLQKIG